MSEGKKLRSDQNVVDRMKSKTSGENKENKESKTNDNTLFDIIKKKEEEYNKMAENLAKLKEQFISSQLECYQALTELHPLQLRFLQEVIKNKDERIKKLMI